MTSVEELIEDFADLDEREACELLDELGREIPSIPSSVYADENLVPGCQSRVWLVNSLSAEQPATVHIQADSDAFVVKGLIYVVLQMFDGKTAAEILELDYASSFDRLGLGRLILPQRKNGLYAMVKKIRAFAAQSLGHADQDTAPPTPKTPAATHQVTRSISTARSEFPILCQTLPNGRRPVFLDSGASAQKPQSVIAKQREVEEQYYANAFRGKYYFGQRVDDEIEATRAKAAQLINAARTDEIIFTSGTTMSINMVAQCWAQKHLGPDDEIVITEMEHHANYVPWQVASQSTGAKLQVVPITEDGQLDLAQLDALTSERTALIAVCSMSNVLGTINPLETIAARARECQAILMVDAAQSLPHAPIDVQALGIDFLSFSGHKLYGPSGIGVLYGRHDHLLAMDPLFYGGHMIEQVDRLSSTWADPPAKFEAGTMPIVPIIGLGAAIDFLHSYGYEQIHAHEDALLQAAHQRLSRIPGLRIHGPSPEHKGAIVSFDIEGVSPEDLARRLDDRGVFTRHGHHCAMVLHQRLGVPATTRASFGIYNDNADVEALGEAIEWALTDLGVAAT